MMGGDSYGGEDSASPPTIYIKPLPSNGGGGFFDKPATRTSVPVQPVIMWSEDARELGALVMQHKNIAKAKDYPSLQPHVELMFDRMEYHRSHFSGVFPEPWFMVGKSLLLGPDFTNYWASELKRARFEWLGMQFNVKPEGECSIKLTDYNSSYLPYFFIFWKEEVEDYKAMFDGPPSSMESETLETISDIVAEMSSNLLSDEEIMLDPPLDYIWRPVATGGFTGESTKPEWEIEFDDPAGDLEEEILVSARGQAPKRPSETRDIGVLKPGSLRFHRRIMYLLQKACTRLLGCPYGQSQEKIKRIVSSIGTRKESFYMRDYTKSGMTIPHEVQKAVLSGFYRRRPDLGVKAARFFRDQQLYFKNTDTGDWDLLRPLTGSPLGLFVEGYTILQYAIHYLNLREVSFPSSSVMFSATNDDMVVGGDSQLDMEEYLLVDERNNALLGMQYKDTKSGVCNHNFVFCEEYWKGDKIANKDSLFVGSIVGAWHSANPFMAKEYVYSILLSCGDITTTIKDAVRDTQAIVGYEFHEDEYRWPYLFGGWLPCIKDGLDCSIEWYDGDLRAIAGYWAVQMRIKPKGSLTSKPKLALARKIGIDLVVEPDQIPDWVDLIPLLGTKRTLERHYRRAQTSYKEVFKEYHRLSEFRQQKYQNIMSGKVDYPSPSFEWLKRHPKSVWPKVLPGMKFGTALGRVPKPRYGFKDVSFDMKMAMLRKKGYIDVRANAITKGSQIALAELGILTSCNYAYLPIADEGISVEILKTHYPGFLPWYADYGKVPLQLWEGDSPLECTRLWAFAYNSSLITLMRSWKYILPHINREITQQVLAWIAQVLHKAGMIYHGGGHWDPDEEEQVPVISERSEIIESYVRDVIRDWVPNPDAIVAQMRERIIPLPFDKRPANYDFLRSQQLVLDPFRLVGDNQSTEMGSPSTDPDGEVFDPWSELLGD
jgi:hypothetical protein